MNPERFLREYESVRGFLCALPDKELLTLVGRLGTEYIVRTNGADDTEPVLVESIGVGLEIGREVLNAQRIMLGGPIAGAVG